MNYLIPITVATLITLVVVSGRSTYLPESAEKKLDSEDSQKNVIILEAPAVTADTNAEAMGDKLLLTGENLTSADESVNVVEDEKMKRSSQTDENAESYTIVIPIARRFSSLKELFEIMRKTDSKPQEEGVANSQAYVKGMEGGDSDYLFFIS